jgi:hypothetical protein
MRASHDFVDRLGLDEGDLRRLCLLRLCLRPESLSSSPLLLPLLLRLLCLCFFARLCLWSLCLCLRFFDRLRSDSESLDSSDSDSSSSPAPAVPPGAAARTGGTSGTLSATPDPGGRYPFSRPLPFHSPRDESTSTPPVSRAAAMRSLLFSYMF